MNKKVKAMLLVLCALILVVGSVMGTLAYLTSQDTVTNTFTVGNISITMDEYKTDEYGVADTAVDRVEKNEYKLIPGHTYSKDPIIHVADKSEPCWLFVKVENGIAAYEAAGATTIEAQLAAKGWVETSVDNVYYYKDVVDARTGAVNVPVFTTFTIDSNAQSATYWGNITAENTKVVVTAYAIQSDGFAGTTADEQANAAWVALAGQLNP